MKRLICTKSIAAAAVALGAFVAASAAHARSDVYFSVGVQAPGVYVQPAPVYVQPAPVYLPRPVYVQPQPIYTPAPGYYYDQRWQRRGPYGDRDGDGIPNIYDRSNYGYGYGYGHGHHRDHRRGAHGDLDRDGVPNRYDHAPNNPYRR